jgi:hypothetical protein
MLRLEPVSVNATFNSRRVFCTKIKCSAAWPLAVLHIPAQEGLRNTPLFSQLSLRLTRVCLGKLIVFSIPWCNKRGFRTSNSGCGRAVGSVAITSKCSPSYKKEEEEKKK